MSVKGWTRCGQKGKVKTQPEDLFERILDKDNKNICYTIENIACALQAAYTSRSQLMLMEDAGRLKHHPIQPWQVVCFFWRVVNGHPCEQDTDNSTPFVSLMSFCISSATPAMIMTSQN